MNPKTRYKILFVTGFGYWTGVFRETINTAPYDYQQGWWLFEDGSIVNPATVCKAEPLAN